MDLNRYRRQTLVREIGPQGQESLSKKHVVIIGGGGLGSNSANILTRAGIGKIDIIDDDVVDITNLHRTAVFTENDLGKSKAVVLEERLRHVNTGVKINGIKQKVTSETILDFLKNVDVLIDGTDNIETRYILNATSVQQRIPWVYAGVYGTIGMVMGIIPTKTPCFHCISSSISPPLSEETPVFGILPVTIAALQCTEAVKMLLGKEPSGLLIYDAWSQSIDQMKIQKNPTCICCSKKTTKQ